jgi:MFS family permease
MRAVASQPRVLDRRHAVVTVGCLLAVSVVAFEQLSLATIAPVIGADLGGAGSYSWVFTVFLLAQIVGSVAAGQAADRRGPGGPLLLGVALVAAGLLVAGLAPNLALFLAGRAGQGLGGGMLGASVFAVVGIAYSDALRPRMLALLSSAFVLPALIGPSLAGLLADRLSWRAVFLAFPPLLVLAGGLLIPALRRLQPASGSADPVDRAKLVRAVVLSAGTGMLLSGLAAVSGQQSSAGGRVLGLGAVLVGGGLAGWAVRDLLPPGTLTAERGVQATIAARGLLDVGYFYTEIHLVLALIRLGGHSAAAAGMAVSVGAITWTAGSWTQERLDRRDHGRGRRARARRGVVLMTVGVAIASGAVLLSAHPSLALATLGWGVTGVGMGLAQPTLSTIAFAVTPSGEQGELSSSLLLADLLAPAVAIGVGGALVGAGGTLLGSTQAGIRLALALSPAVMVVCLAVAHRLPRPRRGRVIAWRLRLRLRRQGPGRHPASTEDGAVH